MRLAYLSKMLIFAPVALMLMASVAAGEELFRQSFDDAVPPLRQTWGDTPTEVLANSVEPDVGLDASPGLHLKLDFRGDGEHNLSYWTYDLPEPMPLIEGLSEISFRLKSNVAIGLKIPIAPYGFIYHAPRSEGTGEWETVTLTDAWGELSAWCKGGERDPAGAMISGIIFAVAPPQCLTVNAC